jgi:menaquinol-cytochrome c reductase iron-sulfur subunit
MAQDDHGGMGPVSRRGFVGWAVGLGTGFIALATGIPLVGFVTAETSAAEPGEFVAVADVASIPVGEPFGISFAEPTRDAYIYAVLPHSVYALKKSDTEVVVYSPVCPHLGCQVFFDRQKKEYVCPCHASIFAIDGARTAGPSPRGLDTLPSKIEKGQLMVQWVQYKPGVPEKTPV